MVTKWRQKWRRIFYRVTKLEEESSGNLTGNRVIEKHGLIPPKIPSIDMKVPRTYLNKLFLPNWAGFEPTANWSFNVLTRELIFLLTLNIQSTSKFSNCAVTWVTWDICNQGRSFSPRFLLELFVCVVFDQLSLWAVLPVSLTIPVSNFVWMICYKLIPSCWWSSQYLSSLGIQSRLHFG